MSTHDAAWPAGSPCWLDLSAPDVPAASAFYAAVLPWHVAEPDEAYGGYVMADVGGRLAAGMSRATSGTPAAWTLHFASDDADATAAAVTAHGGTLHLPVTEIGQWGRMALASDPTGAAFGIWQAGEHRGCAVVNEPGGLAWEDLRSSDPDTARAFYHAVFGWDFAPLPDAGPDYQLFCPGGEQRPLGGTGGLMGQGGTSRWIVYLGVADAEAAVATVEARGGTVAARDFDTPFGRMAGLVDPQGAEFWVHQARPDDPAAATTGGAPS